MSCHCTGELLRIPTTRENSKLTMNATTIVAAHATAIERGTRVRNDISVLNYALDDHQKL